MKRQISTIIKRLFYGRELKISTALFFIVLFMSSCVSGGATTSQNSNSNVVQSSSDFNSSVQPSNGGTSQPVEVSNVAFFDYNGDGILSGGEPTLPGITLTYQPGNVSCVTDSNGQAKVELAPGSYSVTINDPSNKFKYITLSNTEFVGIGDGLKVNVRKNQQVSVPLAQGFLTWPFTPDVHVGIVWYFEPTGTQTNSSGFCSDNSVT